MSEKLDFSFYFVNHNEDADPYVGDDFIAIADGLGGAGSSKINVGKINLDEFKKKALFHFKEESISKQLDEKINKLFEPIIDGVTNTSALWASRIVMANYIKFFELFSKKISADEIELISNTINDSLYRVKEKYKLTTGGISGQIVLPTTLASIVFSEEEKKVVAKAIWAGDSRCYALTKNGIKHLSKDDETRDGRVSNLFHCKDDNSYPCKLNYKEFEFEKPCCFFVCSDGVFDQFNFSDDYPTEDMLVEYYFLKRINESNNINEVETGLYELYRDKYPQDDVTVAFKSFGFDTFENLKSYYKDRTETIIDISNRYTRYRNDLHLLNISSSNSSDIDSYIEERINVKLVKIVKKLLDNDYLIIKNLVVDYFNGLPKEKSKDITFEEFKEQFNANKNEIIINDEILGNADIKCLIERLTKKDENINPDIEPKKENYIEKALGYVANQTERINDLIKEKEIKYEEIKRILLDLQATCNVLEMISKGKKFPSYGEYEFPYNSEIIKELINASKFDNKSIETKKNNPYAISDAADISILYKKLKDDVSLRDTIYEMIGITVKTGNDKLEDTDNFINRMNNENAVQDFIIKYQNQLIKLVKKYLKRNNDSIIDDNFNKEKLNMYRNGNVEVDGELIKELENLIDALKDIDDKSWDCY